MSEAAGGDAARPASWLLLRAAKALGIVLALIAFALIALAIVANLAGYRQFYVPSESMAPTFAINDRFVARMGAGSTLQRGDIVLVTAQDEGRSHVRIVRVAALAGDRISLSGGIVTLNGEAVTQRQVAVEPSSPRSAIPGGSGQTRRLAERFPGEALAHHIYDQGIGPYDDVEEQVVRPGHVFLLGDNRDNAADSRVPIADMGLGQLPLAHVVGRPLFFLGWGTRDWGESID